MNTPLRRIAVVVIVMFLALMGAATWVQYVQAAQLNADPRNVRTLYREYDNFRGPIVVGGAPVASSAPVDDPFGYQRTYAAGPLYAHATGYYSIVFGRTGLERAANDVLTGTADSLFLSRVQDLVTGRQPQGSSVELTLDPEVQAAAAAALGDQRGAVVAIDPATGAILALVSSPSFDPNALAGHSTTAVNEASLRVTAVSLVLLVGILWLVYRRVATVLVNLVDNDELIVAARAGLDLGKQPPRHDAFSGYAIRSEEVFVVPDATKDPRFTLHPLVTGEPGIRFYAGAPLIYRHELLLGCLCLFDTAPREFSLGDRAELAEVTDGLISVLIQRDIDTWTAR